MIKSLRTKILSCFFLLALVMIIGVVLIAISFQDAVRAANTMSGTYLSIERDFGDANTNLQNLVKRFFLVQAMAPTGAMDTDDGVASMVDPGKPEQEALKAALDDLGIQVQKVNNPDFSAEYDIMNSAGNIFLTTYKEMETMFYAKKFSDSYDLYFANCHEAILQYEENVGLMKEQLQVLVDQNNASLQAAEKSVHTSIIIGSILSIIVSIIGVYVVNKTISPLRSASVELNDILASMNAGNANLSRRIQNSSTDEVGVLVSGINNFLSTLQDIIVKIKSESGHIYSSVENIPGISARAAFTTDSSAVFKESKDTNPIRIDDKMEYMPWGQDNQMPYEILKLIENDETLSTCQMFNAEIVYGDGLRYTEYAARRCRNAELD